MIEYGDGKIVTFHWQILGEAGDNILSK
jgi:hypothetical protein